MESSSSNHLRLTTMMVALIASSAVGCTCAPHGSLQWFGCKPAPSHGFAECLGCKLASPIERPKDVSTNLLAEPNEKVDLLAVLTGGFTTPFKRIGFFGWKDFCWNASVIGIVTNSVLSTDGFCTVDVQIEKIEVEHKDQTPHRPAFIRAEICGCYLRLRPSELPRAGDRVLIEGRLKWDGDSPGFFEVHPHQATGVKILERSQ